MGMPLGSLFKAVNGVCCVCVWIVNMDCEVSELCIIENYSFRYLYSVSGGVFRLVCVQCCSVKVQLTCTAVKASNRVVS